MENWIRISDRTPCIGEEIVVRFCDNTKIIRSVTEENYTIIPKVTKPILELEDEQLISLYKELKDILKDNKPLTFYSDVYKKYQVDYASDQKFKEDVSDLIAIRLEDLRDSIADGEY